MCSTGSWLVVLFAQYIFWPSFQNSFDCFFENLCRIVFESAAILSGIAADMKEVLSGYRDSRKIKFSLYH